MGKNRKIKVLFTFVWILLVLYPNPYRLFQSINRSINPPIDAIAITHLLEYLPDTSPQTVERFVLAWIPYQYDWLTYSVPWYYPTVHEVLYNGAGDCKSRMIVLASFFEALNIPYELRYSLNHYWLHYEGRAENNLERAELAFFQRQDEKRVFSWPAFDFQLLIRSFVNFLGSMPQERGILLVMGTITPSITINRFVKLRKKSLKEKMENIMVESSVFIEESA